MNASTIQEIKAELEHKSNKELLSLCLRLAKFKKENKELLSFLLFESYDINTYIKNIKSQTDDFFKEINTSGTYYIKKSIRKILRYINKQIKFASTKLVEAELLIHFCNNIIFYKIPLNKSRQLQKIFDTQFQKMETAIETLHPDLQYDLKKQIIRLVE